MVRTIAAMAQNLELSVVAEGVATEAQAQALAALGCETGQGELFGLAASARELHPVAAEPAPKLTAAQPELTPSEVAPTTPAKKQLAVGG